MARPASTEPTATDRDPASDPPAAGQLPGEPRRRMRAVAEGGDAYVRGADGAWRRTADGELVADATDVTLTDLFDPPVGIVDGDAVRFVPRAWASRHPDHPLAWIYDHAELGDRGPIVVPSALWDERSSDVVAMASPVLHPWNLVGTDGVAAILGVTEATVRAYLARRQMPGPLVRLGRTPVWSRDQIEAWHATRGRARRTGRARRLAEEGDDDAVDAADDLADQVDGGAGGRIVTDG